MSLMCKCQMLMLRYSDGVGQLSRRICSDDPAVMLSFLTLLRRFFDDAVCMCPYAARQVSLRCRAYTQALLTAAPS
jgi:hypothetical protein